MEEGAPKLTTARRLKASCTCLRGAPPTVPYESIACSACTIVMVTTLQAFLSPFFLSNMTQKKGKKYTQKK
jgi:hypothetical protein